MRLDPKPCSYGRSSASSRSAASASWRAAAWPAVRVRALQLGGLLGVFGRRGGVAVGGGRVL